MMDEIKKAAVWQEALDVASRVVQLCEEFSDDQNVLASHLRGLAIDIPASIASDLTHKREPNTDPLVRCMIVLELVHKIYPAVDTEAVEAGLSKIVARIEKNTFAEQRTESKPAATQQTQPPIGSPAPVPVEKTPGAATATDESTAAAEAGETPIGVTSIKINQDN